MAKRKKMLSDTNAPYIQSLMRFIETQSKTTLARWAIDYAQEYHLPLFEKHIKKLDLPEDTRPYQALMAAQAWLDGQIKLPEAKKAILRCHESARAYEDYAAIQAAAAECAKMQLTLEKIAVSNEPKPARITWHC